MDSCGVMNRPRHAPPLRGLWFLGAPALHPKRVAIKITNWVYKNIAWLSGMMLSKEIYARFIINSKELDIDRSDIRSGIDHAFSAIQMFAGPTAFKTE